MIPMKTLVLKCSAPLQSWSIDSRFKTRSSGYYPSRSAIIGIFAAAMGMERDEPLNIFDDVAIIVRVDKGGTVLPDYQSARRWTNDRGIIQSRGNALVVSDRYYIEDAIFMVFVSANDTLIERIANAIQHPVYSLFLGRKSCPPTDDFLYGLLDTDIEDSLSLVPSQSKNDTLTVIRNAKQGEVADDVIKDNPRSFTISNREYSGRRVIQYKITPTDDISKKQPYDDIMEAVDAINGMEDDD